MHIITALHKNKYALQKSNKYTYKHKYTMAYLQLNSKIVIMYNINTVL